MHTIATNPPTASTHLSTASGLVSATVASAADVQRALSGETFVFACVIGDVALSTEADPSAVDADAFAELQGTAATPCFLRDYSLSDAAIKYSVTVETRV